MTCHVRPQTKTNVLQFDCMIVGKIRGEARIPKTRKNFFGFEDNDDNDPNETVPVQKEQDVVPVVDNLRRSQRPNFGVPPARYNNRIGLAQGQSMSTCAEPSTYREAIANQESEKWKAAIDEEMASLRDNDPHQSIPTVQRDWVQMGVQAKSG